MLLKKTLIALSALVALTACEGPPPDTPPDVIARGLAGQTHYTKVDNYYHAGGVSYGFADYVYHRPDGIATQWTQRFGGVGDSVSQRRWSVQQGQVCYASRATPSCKNVYAENGRLRLSSGTLRAGDIGRTQRRNGLRPHNASNLTLAQGIEQGLRALQGVVDTAAATPGGAAIVAGVQRVCANGGCEVTAEDQARFDAENRAKQAAEASLKQCKAVQNSCLSQCSGLSGVGDGTVLIFNNVGSSPKSRCQSQCRASSC